MPSYYEIARDGGMALLMGLLIGLEREHSQKGEGALFAGVRTFPLIALIGFLAALEIHVVPQPFDHMQADISQVIGTHHVIARELQDAGECITEDGAA